MKDKSRTIWSSKEPDKEPTIEIHVDQEMGKIARQICDYARSQLGSRRCWLVIDRDKELRIEEGPLPKLLPGDQLAFLYWEGKCGGAADASGPLFRQGADALWQVALKLSKQGDGP